MYIFITIIDSVFILSVASATVSVDTMEFGQPNKNYHFQMFALSVATATVSAHTIILCVRTCIKNYHFYVFTLSNATATVSVDTIIFVYILTTTI